MPKRTVIEIDEDLCVGCGLCTNACMQGAIEMVNGKAKLVKEDYCDGLGNCIEECPVNAITFIEKEINSKQSESEEKLPCGCPGSMSKEIKRENNISKSEDILNHHSQSYLTNWPVQMKLIPVSASYLKNADILLSADCVPFAYANFHKDFIETKPVIIGCPKLDESDLYIDKLAKIIEENQIKSVKIIKMEVPCCSGLIHIAKKAIEKAEVNIPLEIVTISIDGKIAS